VTNVANREVDGVSVVTPYGRIVFGEQSNAVREKVNSLVSEGKKQIVLDMENIDYVDSSGLGGIGRRTFERQYPGCSDAAVQSRP
jgi:anti-anti-sigma factor